MENHLVVALTDAQQPPMELAAMIWTVLRLVVLHLRTTTGHHHQHRPETLRIGAPRNGRNILHSLEEGCLIARLSMDMVDMKNILVCVI